MTIIVPQPKQEISAESFGIPVANALNRGIAGAAISTTVPGVTVASGATTTIVDKTFTVPADLPGFVCIWAVNCNTQGVGDMLVYGPSQTYNNAIPTGNSGVSGAGVFTKPAGATQFRIYFSIFAWGGASVIVDTTKSNFTLLTLGFASRDTLVFPS